MTAGEDADVQNGSRTITHVVTGGGHNDSGSVMLVTEGDNEVGFTFHESLTGPAIEEISVAEGASTQYWIGVVGSYSSPVGLGARLSASGDGDITFNAGSSHPQVWWRDSDYSRKPVTVTAANDADLHQWQCGYFTPFS